MAFLNLVSKRSITRWYDRGHESAIQDACKPGSWSGILLVGVVGWRERWIEIDRGGRFLNLVSEQGITR